MKPNKFQEAFINSAAKYRAMVGDVATGKTYVGVWDSVNLCSSFPGITGLIIDRDYKSLKGGAFKEVLEFCGVLALDKKKVSVVQSVSKPILRVCFVNGSTLLFRAADRIGGTGLHDTKLSALALGFFFIDNAQDVEKRILDLCVYRLRPNDKWPNYGFAAYRLSDNLDFTNTVWEGLNGAIIWCGEDVENPYLSRGYKEAIKKGGEDERTSKV